MKTSLTIFCLALTGTLTYGAVQNSSDAEKQSRLYMESYYQPVQHQHGHWHTEHYDIYTGDFVDACDLDQTSESSESWVEKAQSSAETLFVLDGSMYDYETPQHLRCDTIITWPAALTPTNGTAVYDGNYCGQTNSIYGPPFIASEHCGVNDPRIGLFIYNFGAYYQYFSEEYNRTAQAKWKLFTGGKSLPLQNSLWNASASATSVTNKRWTPISGQTGGGQPIDAQKITLGDLGELRAGGSLWAVLPDGTTKDVTPDVKGLDFYTFSVSAQKYHPYISLVTGTTNANLDTNTPEVCVGQLATFTLAWDITPPIVNMVGRWNLPEKFVNQPTNYSSTCVTYVRNGALLVNTNQTSCWYQNQPGGMVSVGMSLLFPNGQTTAIAARGNFSVFRPQILGHEVLAQGAVLMNTYYFPEVALGMLASHGILWQTHVGLDPKFPATLFHAQLLSGGVFYDVPYPAGIPYTCLGKTHDTGGEVWLDNSYPYEDNGGFYENNTVTNAVIPFYDAPSIKGVLCSFGQLTHDFNNYLCFQPASSGSIPVTLERAEWLVNGRTDLVSTNWTLTTSNVAGPYFNNDDSFPQWTKIYKNHGDEH